MTKEWYQSNGYKVSLNIEQAQINRAEDDIKAAYVLPILPTADPMTDDAVAHIVADLAMLLLARRSLTVTRAGAKEKTGQNSVNADAWTILGEMVSTCKMRIKQLRAMAGANASATITDICCLYFRSNFIAN